MATVNFLYRSKKDISFLNLRLLFTSEGKNYVFQGTSRIRITKDYWDKQHFKKTRDPEMSEFQKGIADKMYHLERYILDSFDNAKSTDVNKQWLAKVIEDFYNPKSETDVLPKDIIGYIDVYISYKKGKVAESTIKKYRVVQNLLERFYKHRKKPLLIKDINLITIKEFEDYCVSDHYKYNTIARAVRSIKTFCKHAKTLGLETHPQLDAISISYQRTKPVYLTPDEILQIEQLPDLPEYLDNVRDWFLISYNTAQRVSDFLRLEKNMVKMMEDTEGKNRPFLEFTQKKVPKRMTIPLTSQVMKILAKREGNFPRKLSEQKFNKYFQELCKKAGICEITWGSKNMEFPVGSKKRRDVDGYYEKWELVSSHIGRYSFSTNNYAKNIPTQILIQMTGHATEAMFLNYIGKSGKDMAKEVSKYFK